MGLTRWGCSVTLWTATRVPSGWRRMNANSWGCWRSTTSTGVAACRGGGRRRGPGGGARGGGGEAARGPGAGVGPAAGQVPVHRRAVQPAVVGRPGRVVEVAVVIQQAQLVAHVDQGDAVVAEDQGVAEQDPLDRQVDQVGVVRG